MIVESINSDNFNVNYLKNMTGSMSYNNSGADTPLHNMSLERSPQNDTLELSFKSKSKSNFQEVKDYDIAEIDKRVSESKPAWYDIRQKHAVKGNGIDVEVKDGLSGRNVSGKICDQEVDLTITNSGFDLAKGKIKGTINGQEVKLKYQGTKNGVAIDGLQQSDSDILSRLALIVSAKIYDDIKEDNEMAEAAIITGMI